MKRPDTPAIMGLIGLAALLIVGWVVLTVAGKETPPEAWVALSGVVGIIGGWVGKTLMAETPPAPEVVPTPVAVDVEPAAVLPTSTPAVYPLRGVDLPVGITPAAAATQPAPAAGPAELAARSAGVPA